MNAYETPTPLFADSGRGKIGEDGLCKIDLDPVFLETIESGEQYNHFLTKYGKGDLWIKEENQEHFVVEGTPNLEFSWKIEATQKGFKDCKLEKAPERRIEHEPRERSGIK